MPPWHAYWTDDGSMSMTKNGHKNVGRKAAASMTIINLIVELQHENDGLDGRMVMDMMMWTC